MLTCPGKLRRERPKWGWQLEQVQNDKVLPSGLYSDGKKCHTLVRDTNYVPVQIRGAQGRGSKKTVATTSDKIQLQYQ